MTERAPGSAAALIVVAAVLALAAGEAAPARAQTATPTELADYLGTWTMTASFQGTPVELTLELIDHEGTVRAAISSAMRPQPSLIDRIARTEAGIELGYDADFGGNAASIRIAAAKTPDGLAGTFGDTSGAFSAPFTAVRAATPAGIVEAALAAGGDAAAATSTVRPSRRSSRTIPTAELAIGDKKLRVVYGVLALGSRDHESFLATGEGEVFEYPSARCIKLFTDLDLGFGSTRVATANVAPDYPGVYGLWLKKVEGGGWHLVFNSEGDVWGTMHDPTRDVAEIPLEVSTLDAPEETLTVALDADGERGGVLRIAWGDTVWSAKFSAQ